MPKNEFRDVERFGTDNLYNVCMFSETYNFWITFVRFLNTTSKKRQNFKSDVFGFLKKRILEQWSSRLTVLVLGRKRRTEKTTKSRTRNETDS